MRMREDGSRTRALSIDRSLPVGSGALRRQVHAMFRIVGVFAHLLTETEICYFDFTAARAGAQKNVGRFQIEMNHRWFDTSIEITECTDSLHHHGPSFLLGNQFMLLEEEVDIVAFDVLENSAEPGRRRALKGATRRAYLRVRIDFEDVVQTNDARMIERFENVTFAQCVST